MSVKRRPERIEVVCKTCGVMAELFRPTRTAPIPRLCNCPAPHAVTKATRPRLCIHCATKLNRYNHGAACGPCTHARNKDRPLV